MELTKIAGLMGGIVADSITIREYDSKQHWTAQDKDAVTALLRHLQENVQQVINHHETHRGIKLT